MRPLPVVGEFGRELAALGWVRDLLVAGSLATGDYVDGVSDLDLVAIVDGPVDEGRQARLAALHGGLDARAARALDLGCVYVDEASLGDAGSLHPTWTHGRMVHRVLSGITRAELVLHGEVVFGRLPGAVLADMTRDDVRAAASAEVLGYWAWASRRPWMWLDPGIADLGLTSMARARYAMERGELLTKTEAVRHADAPAWLIEQLAARRRGEGASSPRLRTAAVAWRDTRRTVRRARRSPL